jgi:hypothetical protein
MAMRQKHPIWFATFLGGTIGALIGLAFGAFEVFLFYWTGPSSPRLYVLLILAPTIVCCLFGIFVGVAASANAFGKRASVLVTGFLMGAVLSAAMGLGLAPLGGPLADISRGGIFFRDPTGIVATICLIAMMAAHPCWPDKSWTRIVSALGVASWIFCGMAVLGSSV